MTPLLSEEERKKLCATLRSMYANRWCDCDNEPCDAAADEIEQLAKRVANLEKELGHWAERWPG